MRRDEHIKGIQSSFTAISKDIAKAIVNSIYDDFESRTCDSCTHIKITKFRNYETATCTNEICNEMFDCDIGDNFCCNKYQLKEN